MSSLFFNDIHSESIIEQYQNRILNWYALYGRKSLPWQVIDKYGQRDPYKVWVSEIMLQQTQVSTVIPYFYSFINKFPSVLDLAESNDDVLMQQWAGLGYYARARNLKKAAQIIQYQYQGKVPDKYQDLIQLPGIGPSTAGAILSMAYGKSVALLDGNVKRFLARLNYIDAPINQVSTEKRLWHIAQNLMPYYYCAEYSQALMDIGTKICTKTKPLCNICPVNDFCLSYAYNDQHHIPVKTKQTKRRQESAIYYIIYDQDQVLFYKRPKEGLWGGLFSLPFTLPVNTRYINHWVEVDKHLFTHIELHYSIEMHKFISNKENEYLNGYQWVNISYIDRLALPRPLAKHLSTWTNQYFFDS
jgi:A/G-specific adenine glycosylase